MRLWTLHPKYLDQKGLVAVWREALLAQAVLMGRTTGYTRHPQLSRFRKSIAPVKAIARYLMAIHEEAALRGYSFNRSKIEIESETETDIDLSEKHFRIEATDGQLMYEWNHLKLKLEKRAPEWLDKITGTGILFPEAHPLFTTIPGPVAEWEIVK